MMCQAGYSTSTHKARSQTPSFVLWVLEVTTVGSEAALFPFHFHFV